MKVKPFDDHPHARDSDKNKPSMLLSTQSSKRGSVRPKKPGAAQHFIDGEREAMPAPAAKFKR